MSTPVEPGESTHPGGWLGDWLGNRTLPTGDPEPVYVGRAIMTARTALRIGRNDLAQRAGVSYPYLAQIETGAKTPSAEVMRRIAENLALTPAQIRAVARMLVEIKRLADGTK